MRFNHIFKLTNENETHREYKCDNVNINIDFISGSALRVAVFNDNAEMLPTFTVNPNNNLSSLGRSRLSVDGFDCVAPIVEKFEKINELYQEYENIAAVYDELLSVIKDTESKDIMKQLILNLKNITEFPVPSDINNITAQEKDEIIYWVDQSYERLYKLSEQKGLPDNFKYGDIIEIQNGLEKYQFNIGEFSGIAVAGDQEDIDLSIKDQNGKIIGKGHISLTVGNIDFDEDGCASNGIDDSIEYYYEDIVKALENIAEVIEQDIKKEGDIAGKIEKIITTE